MTKEYVSRKLHSLSNLIMRYFDNSPIKKSLDQVTGTNGWIIGYLADHDDRVILKRNSGSRVPPRRKWSTGWSRRD